MHLLLNPPSEIFGGLVNAGNSDLRSRDLADSNASLDGGITKSMNQPEIKEDTYTARTPTERQSVGTITKQKHDQSGFMINHNYQGGSNQKNMIKVDIMKITAVKVEATKEKMIYQDIRLITSSTRNHSSSTSDGGFNQKMHRRLKDLRHSDCD
nr:hypothetical protein [Tanacetum cinerariifolium]